MGRVRQGSLLATAAILAPPTEEIAANQEAAGLQPELFVGLAKAFTELSHSAAASRSPEEAGAGAKLEDVLARLEAPDRCDSS